MFKEFDLKDFENSAKTLEKLIENNKKQLEQLLKIEEKTYENFVHPFAKMGEELEQFCTPIFHMDGVKNSETTQKVYNECLPLISIYSSQLASNEYVYSAIKDIQYKYNSSLTLEQQKVLENEIRDFKLGGCGLNDEDKQTLEDLNLKLSELGKEFSQNLLDATNDWEMILEDFEDVKEIPASDLEIATFVDENDKKTKYRFTLQMPSYIAYITYGTNREKREEIYKAYCTRAPQNGKLIEQILELKQKEAKLLGFENYAQLSLATKMAKSEDEVLNFLLELGKYSQDKAKEEVEELKEFSKKDGCEDIQSYDLGYYSQKLKEEKYDIDEEYYRPYF
ncbi:MAG: M3 family metallopeptidase, partial [Arcobacteraceae bacterium]